MIVVTKCPVGMTSAEMQSIREEVRQNEKQEVFFSRYIYGNPYRMYGQGERLELNANIDVLLVVAIAGTEYLLDYVDTQSGEVKMLEYRDHHSFSNFDIGNAIDQVRWQVGAERPVQLPPSTRCRSIRGRSTIWACRR